MPFFENRAEVQAKTQAENSRRCPGAAIRASSRVLVPESDPYRRQPKRLAINVDTAKTAVHDFATALALLGGILENT